LRLYVKGLRGISKMFNLRPWRALLAPAIHLPVLFTFMLATRDMVRSDVFDMSTGGALWFSDLGAVDSTMLLPAAAVGVTYWNLERAFGRSETVDVSQVFREVFQTGVMCSLPFVVNLPAGVFMLWIPSGLYTMSQSAFLNTAFVQGLVMRSLPPPVQVGADGKPISPDAGSGGSKDETDNNNNNKAQKLSAHPPQRKRRIPFPMRVGKFADGAEIDSTPAQEPLTMKVKDTSDK
jgi:membrane protein insertase Oxa1/YidC/SpoIIIJ